MKIARMILPAALMLIVITQTQAQSSYSWDKPYETALGVRVGGTSGVSLKHMYSNSNAVEAIVGTFGSGFSITALFEKHRNAFDAPGLNWFYGAGAHVAFYNGNSYYKVNGREVPDRDNHDVGLGINGIIGLEYVLPDDIPLAFSLDFKPFVEVDNDGDVGVAPDIGVGIKFLIR